MRRGLLFYAKEDNKMRSTEVRATGKAEEHVMSFDAALNTVLEQAARLTQKPIEAVTLADSLGRILAEPVKADRDQPPFNRSTRDGFAVRAEDASSGEW